MSREEEGKEFVAMIMEFLKGVNSGRWSDKVSHPGRLSASDSESEGGEQQTGEGARLRSRSSEGPPIETLEELHHHTFRILSNTADPHRLERAKRMLERYTGEDWRLWKQRFSSSSAAETYGRSAVWGHTGCFQLLTLTWTPGCSSPIHNHPCERCFLLPLQGKIVERRYFVCEDTKEVKEFLYTPLQLRRAYWMDDSIGWHAISNEGDECAVSLHLYIPAIRKCKIVNPRTKDIYWCLCPSSTRDSLPAASVRLLEIVAAAIRANQSSDPYRVSSSSTFSSTPDRGLISPTVPLDGATAAAASFSSSVVGAAGCSCEDAAPAEPQPLGSCTASLPQGLGQQWWLKLLLQGFHTDAEAELQQVLTGGRGKNPAIVSLFSNLLRPFSYYNSCAAALPPAACAAVVMHDLMFERNAPPLADGAVLQQMCLVLLLALMLFNKYPVESPTPLAEVYAGILPRPRPTRLPRETHRRASAKTPTTSTAAAAASPRNPPPRATAAPAAAPAAAGGGSSGIRGEGGGSSAEENRRERTLPRDAFAGDTLPNENTARRHGALVGVERRASLLSTGCLTSSRRSSGNSRRRSSGEESLLRLQLQEAAMRAVEAYGNSKNSRVWDGWQEAPQLACVGRLLAAQLLLSESDDPCDASVASTGETRSRIPCAACGHCCPTSFGAPGSCCCSSGCCSRCMAAAGASPVVLVLRFLDQAMLFHLASFLGWEGTSKNATPSKVSAQRRAASSLTDGAAAEPEAVRRVKAPGVHRNVAKGQEGEGARVTAAEQFLFSRSSSLSVDRYTRPPQEAGQQQCDSGSGSRSSSHRVKAPSVFYRNDTRSSCAKAGLLDLLRASMAEGGAGAAQKDPAVQEAAANVVDALLDDVERFSPLGDVVCCSLLRLHSYREKAASAQSPRRLARGEWWGKYETYPDEKEASSDLAAHTCLHPKEYERVGNFGHQQGNAASDFLDIERRRHSLDRIYSRRSSKDEDSAAAETGRRSESLFSGWMGAVKKRLGIAGSGEIQAVPLSSSGDSVPRATGLGRHGSQRTVRRLTRDSFAAQRGIVSQARGSSAAGVKLFGEKKDEEIPEQQQPLAPLPRDSGDATPSPSAATTASKRGCHDERGFGCCSDAAAARVAPKDAFAACWLPAKEEHLALFRVLVAALHAFLSRESRRPQELGSRKHHEEPAELSHQLQASVKQQAEGNSHAEECGEMPRSPETHPHREIVAGCGVEKKEGGRFTEQALHGDQKNVEGVCRDSNSGEHVGDAAELSDTAQDDRLCVYHFVAKHLDRTPNTFAVYCSEGDVAQLAALQRALQVFEGDGYPCISKKLKIEVVRATEDGLLDVQDLRERLSAAQHNSGKTATALGAAGSDHASSCRDTIRSLPSNVRTAAGKLKRGHGGETDGGGSKSADPAPAFEQSTAAGCPLIVCCSAGRAGGVRCGFDAFMDLRQLCSQHHVWLHVDASAGAAFLLPQEKPFRKYYYGVNEADSLLWGFSPPLLGQALSWGVSPPSGQSPSSASAPVSYLRGDLPSTSIGLVESVWENTFPVALLSRNPASFFLSNAFCCSCSCACMHLKTDRSVGLRAPKDLAGILCGCVSQAKRGSCRGETQNEAQLQKEEGGAVAFSDSSTTCVASSQRGSCLSPPTTDSGRYSVCELPATDAAGLDVEDGEKLTCSTGDNLTCSSSSVLQESDTLPLAYPHTAGEEVTRRFGGPVDSSSNRNSAVPGTQGEYPRSPGVACARELSALSCKDRGAVLAYWCGAGRKVVGLGFSVWCFWKKLGDVGVANRARQVYLHCRRLELFATNFPLRLKPPEYPTFVKRKQSDTETRVSAAESSGSAGGSTTSVMSSNSEDDSSDDVAGGYDIDDRVLFDYEYARLHEASVLPLVASAAVLLGLPESSIATHSTALRDGSAGCVNSEGSQDEKEVGKRKFQTPTTGDRSATCPFHLCFSSSEEGHTRRRTSPSTISFRWWYPGGWLTLKPTQHTLDAAVAAETQRTVPCLDHVTRQSLEGRIVICLKRMLDTLKKRQEEAVAPRGQSSVQAGERSTYSHAATESSTNVTVRAAGLRERDTPQKEGDSSGATEKGRHAVSESEESKDSDADDVSSESAPLGEDEEEASFAAKVPSFTLLTRNFLIGIGSSRRSGSAVPAQGSASVERGISPGDTADSTFLTISPMDPRMTEDDCYSLLYLIDRLGELLWSSSTACTGSRDTPFNILSPDHVEFPHRCRGGSLPMPR